MDPVQRAELPAIGRCSVLWLILGPQADGLAVLVLALGGITDWLDGIGAGLAPDLSDRADAGSDRRSSLHSCVLIGLALREIVPWWLVVIVVGRDVFIPLLIPVLKTRGYSSLPVHFVGKIATFSLLYAFPLVLLGSGEEGWLQLAWVLGGIRHLGHCSVLVRRRPLRCSDRPFAPLYTADPRPPSL